MIPDGWKAKNDRIIRERQQYTNRPENSSPIADFGLWIGEEGRRELMDSGTVCSRGGKVWNDRPCGGEDDRRTRRNGDWHGVEGCVVRLPPIFQVADLTDGRRSPTREAPSHPRHPRSDVFSITGSRPRTAFASS